MGPTDLHSSLRMLLWWWCWQDEEEDDEEVDLLMGGAGSAAKKPQQAKGLAATLALLRNTGRHACQTARLAPQLGASRLSNPGAVGVRGV